MIDLTEAQKQYLQQHGARLATMSESEATDELVSIGIDRASLEQHKAFVKRAQANPAGNEATILRMASAMAKAVG